MTTVRIAHAEPQPGRLANGEFQTRGFLVVLADDAGRRAVPIWMGGAPGASDLSHILELARRPAGEVIAPDAPQELTARLMRAAGASVTGVDLELAGAEAGQPSPEDSVARIEVRGRDGSRPVTAALGLGLALAAAAGAPVRVAGAAMDRLAVPVPGQDLLTPFLDRVPPGARARPGPGLPGWPFSAYPDRRLRFEPRNLDFAAGLDQWDLGLSVRRAEAVAGSAEAGGSPDDSSEGTGSPGEAGSPGAGAAAVAGDHEAGDYMAAADDGSAVLRAVASRPAGTAELVQAIYADDYRGATVTFHGEIRTQRLTAPAGLRLEILPHWWRAGRAREDHGITVAGGSPWTRHEVTARIPGDADTIRFGIALTGPGQIALRNAGWQVAGPDDGA